MNYDIVGNDPAGRALVDNAIRILERDRPDIAVEPIRLIDMGFSSYVLETGSGFIVRIARTADAAAGHAREYVLLRELSGHVAVEVPAPVWRVPAGPESRYGAMAYKRIAGASLARDRHHGIDLVEELTHFLTQLHRTREPGLLATATPFEVWRDGTISVTEAAVKQLAHDLSEADHKRLRHWFSDFSHSVREIRGEQATLVHGDFWHANILTSDERLSGVLDWESASVADPAVDLAPIWDIDQDLGADLLRRYQAEQPTPDPTLDDRIRLLRIARNLGGVIWSVNNNDPAEYADSLIKVQSVLPLI